MLSVPAGALIKTTLVDFPGRVACTFFIKGCNLRCPYCYNGALVHADDDTDLVSADAVMAHLAHRKNVLSGFVMSGGEPLLNPLTPILIRKARELGYCIKLDTNGTLPDKLQTFLSDPTLHPDFIAMDIKTAPDKYEHILAPHRETHIQTAESSSEKLFPDDFSAQPETYADRLIRSVKLISTYSADAREFRTVLVPGLVDTSDIDAIAAILPSDASWQFAQFRNENCLDPGYNNVEPYLDAQLKELVAYAQARIPGAVLR